MYTVKLKVEDLMLKILSIIPITLPCLSVLPFQIQHFHTALSPLDPNNTYQCALYTCLVLVLCLGAAQFALDQNLI